MRRSRQAFSAPSKQTPNSNSNGDLSSIACINASSMISTLSSELSASKPRDFTIKREQNSRYEHDNGLMATVCQPSYPLNSENASPFGTCKVYLSCWARAMPPKTASTTAMAAAPAAADVARTLRGVGNDDVLDMVGLLG